MKILDAIRSRASNDETGPGGDGPSDSFPIPRYDRLDAKAISLKLSGLSQEQLATVEEHERAHDDRAPVLDKLRYLRQDEPMEGYDRLDSREVKNALGSSDVKTIRSVRDYERKFAGRPDVMAETARLLVTAKAG